jgi:CBS domain-containing protein
MKASDLMTSDPCCCTPTTTAQEAARLMGENDCGCIPVVESTDSRVLVGVVTDRDLAVRGLACGLTGDTPVRELMSTEVHSARPNDDLATIERLMTEQQVRRVPVIDDGGCCVGIIAQADLALEDSESDRTVGKVVECISRPREQQLS